MRAVVYTTSDPDVPERFRAVAHLVEGTEMFPLRFNAATPEAAQRDAEAWLAAETERHAERIEARRKAREAREAAKEAAAARKAAEAALVCEQAEDE